MTIDDRIGSKERRRKQKRAAANKKYHAKFMSIHGCCRTTYVRRRDPKVAARQRAHDQRRRLEPKRQAQFKRASLKSRRKLKVDTYNAYGGFRCTCCGETHEEFLSIDHKRNDGRAHRELLGGTNSTERLCRWLRDHNYPSGFQILCMNCNFGRARTPDKRCPHVR